MTPLPIDGTARITRLSRNTVRLGLANTPFTPPASDDDALAREAVAIVEADEFGDQVASFRRHGSYDGDESHRIALEAIRLCRASPSTKGTSGDRNPLVGDQ